MACSALMSASRTGTSESGLVTRVDVRYRDDGIGGQHPTQALLDLYTIYRERPLDE